jgi:hypothetical protein
MSEPLETGRQRPSKIATSPSRISVAVGRGSRAASDDGSGRQALGDRAIEHEDQPEFDAVGRRGSATTRHAWRATCRLTAVLDPTYCPAHSLRGRDRRVRRLRRVHSEGAFLGRDLR